MSVTNADVSPSFKVRMERAGQALDYFRLTLQGVGGDGKSPRAARVKAFEKLMIQAAETAGKNEEIARGVEDTGISDAVLFALTNFFGEATLITDWSSDAPCTEDEKREMLLLTEAYSLMIVSIATAVTMEITRRVMADEVTTAVLGELND